MCRLCDADYALTDTPPVRRAAEAIRALYAVAPTGGFLHIVTDDGNVEAEHLNFCAEELADAPETGEGHILARAALDALLPLTEDERLSAIYFAIEEV